MLIESRIPALTIQSFEILHVHPAVCSRSFFNQKEIWSTLKNIKANHFLAVIIAEHIGHLTISMLVFHRIMQSWGNEAIRFSIPAQDTLSQF